MIELQVAIIRPVEYNENDSVCVDAEDNMDYMTANQAAKKWGISQRRVQVLCAEGRIDGVFKLGEAWAIPANTIKPNDKRVKVSNEEL